MTGDMYHEPIDRPQRLDYGAVPLDPWSVDEDSAESYWQASQARIETRLTLAMRDAATRRGWVESPELAARLYEFVGASLYDSQKRRIDLNPMRLDGIVDLSDPRAMNAKAGTATPGELLALLIDYPKLESLELAKLSHPLDTAATEVMDADVNNTLITYENGVLVRDAPYYKDMKRYDATIPAGIVLRKQRLMLLPTDNGMLQVVQRRGFLVRGDDQAKQGILDEYLDRKIKNPDRFDELTHKIEAYLSHLHLHPDLVWLQPIATSYYAKYLDKDDQSWQQSSE